jgi:hypothetical protein
MFQNPIQTVSAGWFPDGRDSVAHPEFENILCICSLRFTSDVTVHIDKSG